MRGVPYHRKPCVRFSSEQQTFSESPLNAAVKKGNIGAVRVLLGAGAQVNNTDKFGSTVSGHAA